MIKHIVLFQLKEELDNVCKQQVMEKFREAILALPAHISCIRSMEVGFNVNPDECWHVSLCGEFESLDDVKAYAVHPLHLEAAQLIKPYVNGRACTDIKV